MTSLTEEYAAPLFEIDHPAEYGQYFLDSRPEITYYLKQLVQRGKLLTVHINEGDFFFLSTLLAVEEETGQIMLDPASDEALNTHAAAARKLTLTSSLNQVKLQFQLAHLIVLRNQGQRVLVAPIPEHMLRLQRREYFRLQPPKAAPLHCRVELPDAGNGLQIAQWEVADISAGGISLIAPTDQYPACQPGTLFMNCRLEIPDDGVVLMNMRVHKAVEFSTEHNQHQLRLGCEFVNVPASRLAIVERYISRIERQRTAKFSGLAD